MQQDFNPFKYLANPKVSAPDRQLENERNQTEPTVCVVHSSSESSEWKAHTTVMNIFAIPFTFSSIFSLAHARFPSSSASEASSQTNANSFVSHNTQRRAREKSTREREQFKESCTVDEIVFPLLVFRCAPHVDGEEIFSLSEAFR